MTPRTGRVTFLKEAGYKNVAQTQEGRSRAQAQAAAAREPQRLAAKRKAALKEARVQVELPALRKKGTRVCRVRGEKTFMGFVEAFTDEKLKALVTGAYLTSRPSQTYSVEVGTITREPFIEWRLY